MWPFQCGIQLGFPNPVFVARTWKQDQMSVVLLSPHQVGSPFGYLVHSTCIQVLLLQADLMCIYLVFFALSVMLLRALVWMTWFWTISGHPLAQFIRVRCVQHGEFIPMLVIILTLFIFYSNWSRPKMSPFHLTSNLFLKSRFISGMLLFDAQVLELYSSMKNEMPGISCRGFLQSLCLISRKNNRVCCYVC